MPSMRPMIQFKIHASTKKKKSLQFIIFSLRSWHNCRHNSPSWSLFKFHFLFSLFYDGRNAKLFRCMQKRNPYWLKKREREINHASRIDYDIFSNFTKAVFYFECLCLEIHAAAYLGTYSSTPGSRNCSARQRALQIILDLADKSSKRNIFI